MRLFDTHTHLLDARFDSDRDDLLGRLPQEGLVHVLEACTHFQDLSGILELIDRHAYIVASLGTHPHEAAHMCNEHLLGYEAELWRENIVAVGEIGLDYHYDFSPRALQRKWFAEQLELAQQHVLPVILHVREATKDAMDILHAHRNGLRGVMHCFSGSWETARACLDMGLYIAFGGALTFHNAKQNVEVASKAPLERLLIETDCPYMTPAPHRGKRNDPSLVRLVCEKLADIRQMDAEEAAAQTLQNAKDLFGM